MCVVCDLECLSMIESLHTVVGGVNVFKVNKRLLVVSNWTEVDIDYCSDVHLAEDGLDVVLCDAGVDVWEHDGNGCHGCWFLENAFY